MLCLCGRVVGYNHFEFSHKRRDRENCCVAVNHLVVHLLCRGKDVVNPILAVERHLVLVVNGQDGRGWQVLSYSYCAVGREVGLGE